MRICSDVDGVILDYIQGFSFGIEDITPQSINGISFIRRGTKFSTIDTFFEVPYSSTEIAYMDYFTIYALSKLQGEKKI